MSFTSALFLLLFLPACFLICYFSDEKYRNGILLAASVVFYFWCGLGYLILIFLSSVAAYVVGVLIEKATSIRWKRAFLLLGITYSIGCLFYYKYLTYFINLIIRLPFLEEHISAAAPSAALPLGISFYTFSVLSYILDVYWEKCEAQHRLTYLCLYVMFFPKVVQGPIVRYGDFEKQLHGRRIDREMIDHGWTRFIIGMFKKTVIADQLTGIVSYSFEGIAEIGTIPAWIGILGYLLQLYYDFSGYSDMAVGLGEMFGFSLPENFDHPYMSETVSEYWRRWHISLGEWFRDYLYMPLYRSFLGNRLLKKSRYFLLYVDLLALSITWLLTGIWHGSGGNFVLYGLWYFLFIAMERISDDIRKRIRKKKKLPKSKKRLPEKILTRLAAAFAVIVGQVLFRSADRATAMQYLKCMFLWNTKDGWIFLTRLTNSTILAFVLGMIFIFPVRHLLEQKAADRNIVTQISHRVILLGVFFLSFAYCVSAGYSAFLYQVF